MNNDSAHAVAALPGHQSGTWKVDPAHSDIALSASDELQDLAKSCGVSKQSLGGDHPAIEARGLVKVYGEHRALDGIDLTIPRGQVFGFLGPNGAGKTLFSQPASPLPEPFSARPRPISVKPENATDTTLVKE